LPDLLIRHTTAAASHFSSGANRDIYQQLSTILLNEAAKRRIVGKRILVLDDFTTSGNSLETARVMLLKGGAASVVGLAFAKYRSTYSVLNISKNWDPFVPFVATPAQINVTQHYGTFNSQADDFFSQVIFRAAKN
jgi:hypoxanthine phosphoribosyltransferase